MYGYADEVYAVVAGNLGTFFVRLDLAGTRVPENSTTLAFVPTQTTAGSGRSVDSDVVIVGDVAYISHNAEEDCPLMAVDLTQLSGMPDGLPDFAYNEINYTTSWNFVRARSLSSGALPTEVVVSGSEGGDCDCAGGSAVLDVTDMWNPVCVSCYNDSGVIYDADCVTYSGPDADYTGASICMAFNLTNMLILDYSSGVFEVVSVNDFSNSQNQYQGVFSDSQANAFTLDYLTDNQRTPTMIWNMADLDAPVLNRTEVADFRAISGRIYYDGQGRLLHAACEAGLRIDYYNEMTNNYVEVGFFDAYNDDPDDGVTEETGIVAASSYINAQNNGYVALALRDASLFIVKPDIVAMDRMIQTGKLMSERYRYRTVVSQEEDSVCPTTIDRDQRLVNRPELCQ